MARRERKGPNEHRDARKAPHESAHDRMAPEQVQLLGLQRTIGNQGVNALLGGSEPSSGVRPVLQRDWFTSLKGAVGGAVDTASATATLTALSLTSSAELPTKMAAMSDPDLKKWMDDLPTALKATQGYARALVALSTARRAPHVDVLLASGDFGWISTAPDATLFYTFFTAITADQVGTLFARMATDGSLQKLAKASSASQHTTHLQPWIATLPMGEALSADQKTHLKSIFDGSVDTEIVTLCACMNHRFDLLIGKSISATRQGETAVDWEAGGLRRMYPVLAALPVNHVAKNKMLLSMGRYQGTGAAGGYYEQFGKESAMSYGADKLTSANTAAEPGDPLYGVNRFDKVVRHEVGHAVDAEMGWSAGSEPASASRGGWKQYGADTTACVTDMVTAANGPINKLEATKRTEIIGVLSTAMGNKTIATVAATVKALGWVSALDAAKQDELVADPVFAALTASVNNPWYNETGGGKKLGDHVYEESYGGSWARYRQDSRARKVSLYQFRAPGEWFAEVYATYYEPDSKGHGAKLVGKDDDTKKYFDDHVATRAGTR